MNNYTTFDSTSQQLALMYHEREQLSCYPFVSGTKAGKPESLKWMTWGQYKDTPQTTREIETLFSSGSPNVAVICGKPSDNLFVIDCDNHADFETFSRVLTGYGITTWTQQRSYFDQSESHAGGGHFYFKAPSPVQKSSNQFGDVQGHGSYVLAPPSIHPSGSRYIWTIQPDHIFRLDSLNSIPELSLKPADVNKRKTPQLAQAILEGQTKIIGRYKTRSHAEAACVTSLIRAGYPLDIIYTLFLSYPAAGKFRELHAENSENAERWLRLTYQTQRDWLATVENDANKNARACELWAMSKPWPGRTGSTDRANYLAHCQIVKRTGKTDYHASCRELAELAGMGRKTIERSNHRLITDGLLELNKRYFYDKPNVFTLVDSHNEPTPDVVVVQHSAEWVYYENHDLFTRRGLSKSGYEILSQLQNTDGATAAELAEWTGRSIATVYRKLDQMDELGIVTGDNGNFQAADITTLDLDELAKIVGVSGVTKRRKERHIQERREFKLQLIREKKLNDRNKN